MPKSGRPLPDFQLDAGSGVPVYLQLFNQIRRHASVGRLRQGDRLPTVRELATQLEVNFNTVARAYRLLDSAGVVSAQQGRGTFVLHTRPKGRARMITLRALTSHFIAELRRQGFSGAQIAAAVTSRLAELAHPAPAGENHG